MRIAAAGAVIRAGGPVQPSLDVLMAELKPSGSWIEARWAAEEIATIGCSGKKAIPLLVNLLTAEDYYLRESAAVALGAIGPEAHETVGALESCLKDRSEYVAANAAAALWRIARHPAALPALEAALKSDDSMARISAVKALAENGPERWPLSRRFVGRYGIATPDARARHAPCFQGSPDCLCRKLNCPGPLALTKRSERQGALAQWPLTFSGFVRSRRCLMSIFLARNTVASATNRSASLAPK